MDDEKDAQIDVTKKIDHSTNYKVQVVGVWMFTVEFFQIFSEKLHNEILEK